MSAVPGSPPRVRPAPPPDEPELLFAGYRTALVPSAASLRSALDAWGREDIAAVALLGLLAAALVAAVALLPDDGKRRCYATGTTVTYTPSGPVFGTVTLEVPCAADGGAP